MKYHLITYGCQMNTADSEEMAQPLKDRGFLRTLNLHQADIVIMNTCTVREHAEHRALSHIGRLRKWKATNPNRLLVVAGCAATRWGDDLRKKFPWVDLVSPATRISEFPETVAKVLKDRWNWSAETTTAFGKTGDQRKEKGDEPVKQVVSPMPSRPSPTGKENLFGNEATAYITIMRGCNLSCSYCIVPQVRGRELYRPLPDILQEIENKVTEGSREIMLLGQTVNSYRYRASEQAASLPGRQAGKQVSDGTTDSLTRSLAYSQTLDFADLLRTVDALAGVERIRFMSPHPKHMRDRVIEAMADCSKVARHLHLPVQSGSDRLLREMKRLYTRDEYLAIVQKLRRAIPEILITTDVIVGYPGETEEDFADTLALLDHVQFDGLFAFKYSPRPGTPSADQADDVPSQEKEARHQKVLSLNKTILQSKIQDPEMQIL